MMGRHRHVPQESLIESFGFFLLLTLATPTLTLPLQGEGTKLPAMAWSYHLLTTLYIPSPL